jgi:uncharacterized protein (DUF427 family)
MTTSPDLSLTFEPCRRRVRARFANHIIADSEEAVMAREGDLPPVYYFPVDDVEMGYLGLTERITSDPLKGDAAYYSLLIDGNLAENAAWIYEDPTSSAEVLRGRLAFDTDRIEVYEIDDAAIEAGLGHDAARHV